MKKSSDQTAVQAMEEELGYVFSDSQLLIQALTHRSFSNEHRGADHNERLEFLGDTILQFVATIKLYSLFPHESEGVLSTYRSLIVKTDFLIQIAEQLHLRNYIRVSEGQRKEMQGGAVSILADAVEAVIGAIYLDGGLKSAERYIVDKVLINIEEYLTNTPLQDPKSTLQEYIQREMQVTPTYVVLGAEGPDHDKEFTVGVQIGDTIQAQATGRSKQEAEQLAAKKALSRYTSEV